MKWVTRERPVIDRGAAFLFILPEQVRQVVEATGAILVDVPGGKFGHVGERRSFDAFVAHYGLDRDPAISMVAAIVRGADTDRLNLTPQSAGLLAISEGCGRSRPTITRSGGVASSFTTPFGPGPRASRQCRSAPPPIKEKKNVETMHDGRGAHGNAVGRPSFCRARSLGSRG
ncbi:chromate resistance protein ChrB domain-containing protein [Gluconacetobacter tumulicola]|uniref:chromate resistance protein ChrB domain-containing protein n=1 Tax=Gluconacetobacter tumulicola TaxID=1017177 RepID=UPI001FE98AA9|nr:chromate resistance protein ChrB domain-containing protein [Gluconacetobacter tumulicola]